MTTTSVAVQEGIKPKSKIKIIDADIYNSKQYMHISFSYSKNLLLPYDDGKKFIDAISKADQTKYSNDENGLPIVLAEPIEFSFKIISAKNFREAKMNLLLGLNKED